MDLAALKVFSIGALLPSSSLSNVVDVNEHDGCTNDISYDISFASAAAVRDASNSIPATMMKISNISAAGSASIWQSYSSRPFFKKTAQKGKSNSGGTKPASKSVTEISEIHKALDYESRAFELNAKKTRERMAKLYVTLKPNAVKTDETGATGETGETDETGEVEKTGETDKTGEIAELKNLVDSKFVSELEEYSRKLYRFRLNILRMIPVELASLTKVEQDWIVMVSDLMRGNLLSIKAHINKLHEENNENNAAQNNNEAYHISTGLKTDLISNLATDVFLFPVFVDSKYRLKCILDVLVERMNRLKRGIKQSEAHHTLCGSSDGGTLDYFKFTCLLNLLKLSADQWSAHESEVKVDFPEFGRMDKARFMNWLNAYIRFRVVLKERAALANKLWTFIKQMQDDSGLSSISKERREEFKKCVSEESAGVVKTICQIAINEEVKQRMTVELRELLLTSLIKFGLTCKMRWMWSDIN